MTTSTPPRLTKRQGEVYEFLKSVFREQGFGPTIREIGAHLGIPNPNGVVCHLKALEKKGLITRGNRLSRSIRLVEAIDLPGSMVVDGNVRGACCVPASADEDGLPIGQLFSAGTRRFLHVVDDSLSSCQIVAGDHLLVDPQASPRDGGLAVTASGQILRTRKLDDGWQFEAFDDKNATDDTTLDGAVIAVIRQL
ncbi:MAG: repressor LexA [Planctomycetaceae bacterium]